jgi:hypothetical protein
VRFKYPTLAALVWKAAKEPARRGSIGFAELRLPLIASSREAPGDRLEVRLPDGIVVRVVRGGPAEEIADSVRALKADPDARLSG